MSWGHIGCQEKGGVPKKAKTPNGHWKMGSSAEAGHWIRDPSELGGATAPDESGMGCELRTDPKSLLFLVIRGAPFIFDGETYGKPMVLGPPLFWGTSILGVVSTLTPNWLGEVRFGFKSRLVSSSPFEIFLAKVDSWPVGRLLGSEWVRRNNANGVWSLPCHHLQPFSRSFLYRGMNLEISLLLRVLPGIICCQLSLCTSFAHL